MVPFLTSDGEKSYRNRDQEFKEDMPSKQEMILIWEKGWDTLQRVVTTGEKVESKIKKTGLPV